MKKNHKLVIQIEKDFKEKLEAKARSLNISTASFIRMILSNALRGELVIN